MEKKELYLCIEKKHSVMTTFIGEYKAKVDDRGRMVFPSAFKTAMGDTQDRRLVIKKALFSPCLEVYTYTQWQDDSEQVRSRLNFFNREHDAFWREYMRGTAIVEPDEKFGRILVPKSLLETANIANGTEVVFSGANHKITIWSKDAYEAQSMRSDEFVALAEKILG